MPNGIVEKFWVNHNMLVFKQNNLVYIATLKCGHSFYSKIVQHNNWKQISFNDIDWENDHVCGFIMNPVQRYLKGLTQDILENEECISSVETLLKYHIKNNFTLLSLHSAPLWSLYREKMYNIDWIPLDAAPSSEFFFNKLCSEYKINLDIPVLINRHTSSNEQNKLFNNLSNLLGTFSETFYRLYSADIDLHNNVISNFNPNGNTWKEISWIKKII